jgi:hypothetical protein
LLDAGVADADEGEFRGGEECVGCDQEQDQKDPEQHESHHGNAILANRGAEIAIFIMWSAASAISENRHLPANLFSGEMV